MAFPVPAFYDIMIIGFWTLSQALNIFRAWQNESFYKWGQKEPDELELYEKLDLILDFYERLVYRLRIMVKDADECGYILFLACVFVQKREEFKY